VEIEIIRDEEVAVIVYVASKREDIAARIAPFWRENWASFQAAAPPIIGHFELKVRKKNLVNLPF
jgi:hypothetical protein